VRLEIKGIEKDKQCTLAGQKLWPEVLKSLIWIWEIHLEIVGDFKFRPNMDAVLFVMEPAISKHQASRIQVLTTYPLK
jgi:hypothetical protein